MLFSSIIFLFYFLPVILILYFICRFSRLLQNMILLIFSLLFYAWGEPRFVLIMLASIIANYLFGLMVNASRGKAVRTKIIMTLMVAANLGTLFIFKYLNFTVRNINAGGMFHLTVPEVVLPIGISFFTFQAMSYVIDVCRGTAQVQKNPFYLGLYISFFPQLIAGPIVRYNTIAEQIVGRKETSRKFSVGTCRFITGLGKKILIANNMAIVADHIFDMCTAGNIPASLAWLGSISYTLQIFFDFSAYSDMAIGLGLMFGFEFEENFNYPYISKSITEFWRRWHMSLSTWFRDYVYFPLGGSHVENKDKMIRNLLIVWFLTGVWHGAEWTFIIWGLLNFVFIVGEKLTNFTSIKGHSTLKHIYSLFIINLGWVIFRSVNLREAGNFIACMFGMDGFWSDYTWMFLKEYAVFFIIGVILCMPVAKRANRMLVDGKFPVISRIVECGYPVALLGMFVVCVTYLVKGTYNPFIYFNF